MNTSLTRSTSTSDTLSRPAVRLSVLRLPACSKLFYHVRIVCLLVDLCGIVYEIGVEASQYTTGAQDWHIVSLLGDVTCPTTAVHYVSVTSDLRVLNTEKHCPVRRQHTVYKTRVFSSRGKYIVRH